MRYAVAMVCMSACPVLASPVTENPYNITDAERAACTDDAIRLCSSAYPDQRKLLVCMKANRLALSALCLPVFDAGIKKRHL